MWIEKKPRILLTIICSVLFTLLIFLPALSGAEQKGAADSVKMMNAALMECMKKADDLGFRGRYKLLAPVINEVFALQFMGQVSMGSYWKDLTPEQKKQFLGLYTDWTISSYAGNFDGYSGEKFVIQKGQEEQGEKAYVLSNLVRPREETIDFNYTLRRIRDKWRIVDIKVSGVSQLALTRSQFVTVMKKNGFDGLVSSLKGKIADLKAKEGAKK